MAAAQYYDQIQKAYIAYYGRPADPAGQDYWATQLDKAGGNLDVIINAFGNSVESTHL
jgi:S-layer protein